MAIVIDKQYVSYHLILYTVQFAGYLVNLPYNIKNHTTTLYSEYTINCIPGIVSILSTVYPA